MIYISDVDGTLIDDLGKVSLKTIDTVKKMNESEHIFTIATARSLGTAKSFIKELELKHLCILQNGCAVYDPIKKEYCYRKEIKLDTLNEVIEDLVKLNRFPLVVGSSDGKDFVKYTRAENQGEKFYIDQRSSNNDKRLEKIEKYDLSKSNSYYSLCTIEEDQEEVNEFLCKKYGSLINTHCYTDSYTGYTWLEITDISASKAIACKYVSEYYNLKEYIAFGDSHNDIGMLDNAKNSFIPINSKLNKEKKKYSVIASSNDSCVANYLLNSVLKR